MDFTVTKTTSKIQSFQLKAFIVILIRLSIIAYILFSIIYQWTFMNLIYFPILAYFVARESNFAATLKKYLYDHKEELSNQGEHRRGTPETAQQWPSNFL